MTDRAFAVALVAFFITLSSSGRPAHGSTGPAGSTGLPSSAATCVLRGIAEPRVNANIEDSQGRVIARFSGAPTALLASDFPADAHGRVRIETGTGAGGFRIRGQLAIGDLPLYTTGNVAVVQNHVWIGARRSVSFIASAPGRLRIEKRLSQPFSQSFLAWAPCNAVSLAAAPPPGFSPEGNARGYLLKKSSLELFDQPATGSPISTLTRSGDVESVLFFSSERRGDFVSLSYHGEVLIEAWARARDLSALDPGETSDQLAQRGSTRSAPRLAVQGEPRVVKPARDVPLRAAAKESEATIGVVEPGAETFVLDVVAGWASVMPKAMNVLPGPDGQFWVKASDLGI
jgi:hypothetical protein